MVEKDLIGRRIEFERQLCPGLNLGFRNIGVLTKGIPFVKKPETILPSPQISIDSFSGKSCTEKVPGLTNISRPFHGAVEHRKQESVQAGNHNGRLIFN
jgi:hypothetical protein